MATFRFSAFADEYSENFDEQIVGLKINGISMIEIRGIDGTPIVEITEKKAKELKKKLDAAGIAVSAVGSPLGKVELTEDFEEYKKKIHHICKLAEIFETKRVRVFSFYIPTGDDPDKYTDTVLDRMDQMISIAEGYGLLLCIENEKRIFGDSPDRSLLLAERFAGRVGLIFDPCNFVQCGFESFPDAFVKLKDKITYMHIKDCTKSGAVVLPGHGIGGIPEILAYLNRTRDDEIILTMEPHLMEFHGLKGLEKEGDRTDIKNQFATHAEAFAAAITAARLALPNGAVEVR